MKKNIFFAALAATAMLASCSEEPVNPGGEQGEAETARITIKLQDPTAQTRAFDTDADDNDAKINDLIVFVTRDGGDTFDISPVYFGPTELANLVDDDYKIEVLATSKADKIYVVTNTGPLLSGAFKAATSMAVVKSIAMKIDGNPNTQSNVKKENVWMGGNSEGAFTTSAPATVGGIAQVDATVKLYFIPAKVFVVTENHMTNYNPTTGKTKLTGVQMTNVGAWTGFVNKTATTGITTTVRPDFSPSSWPSTANAFYYNGVAITAFPANYDDAPEAPLTAVTNAAYAKNTGFSATDMAATTATPGTYTNRDKLTEDDAFYVFPTRGDTKVWASVYGSFDADAAGTAFSAEQRFWSVAFGGVDGTIKEEIGSGNKYILTIELGFDDSVPGGDKDPTVETVNKNLNITLEPQPWNVISEAHKTFE